jgi:hypothetical protein
MEAFQERIRLLEENVFQLSKHNEQLEREKMQLVREKMLNFDSRLLFFGRNVKGSHSYRSNSNNSERNQILKSKTKAAKDKAKKIFTDGEVLSCVICRKTESITIAHIVSSALSDYTDFGVKNNYNCEIDVFSERNFMPLCGTEGEANSCHDAIDKHQIHICYDTFHRSYHLSCSPNAPERFKELSESKLITAPGWNPYRRLLAWRSRKCGTECGFVPDFPIFEAMNQISEESNSVGDAESDDGVSSSTDNEDDAEVKSKRSQVNSRRPKEFPDNPLKRRRT